AHPLQQDAEVVPAHGDDVVLRAVDLLADLERAHGVALRGLVLAALLRGVGELVAELLQDGGEVRVERRDVGVLAAEALLADVERAREHGARALEVAHLAEEEAAVVEQRDQVRIVLAADLAVDADLPLEVLVRGLEIAEAAEDVHERAVIARDTL